MRLQLKRGGLEHHFHRGDVIWSNKIFPLTEEPGDFKAKTYPFEHDTKPDIAFGLHFLVMDPEVPPPDTDPFSKCWETTGQIDGSELETLEEIPDARLHARPSKCELVYPCLIHEVESGQIGLELASKQLSISLAYALDQQEELRRLAGAAVDERMPVVGVASSGSMACIWYGAYVGNKIVSRTSW